MKRFGGSFWISEESQYFTDSPRFNCGERGGNRTYNLLIKSQLLCQLSYAPATFTILTFPHLKMLREDFVM